MLTDTRISYNDLRVYIALASFQGKNSDCFPSLKAISERSGVHIKNVSKHTARLRRFGWIEVIRRGKKMPNRYRVKSDSVVCADSQKDLKSDSVVSGVCDSVVCADSILKEQLKEESSLTFAQKHFASINQQLLKKDTSKVPV